MLAAIQAPINTFAASGDDKPFGSRARENLMHIRIGQPGNHRPPLLTVVIANEHAADFDSSEKSARCFMVGGDKPRARSQLGARREAAAVRAFAHACQFLPAAAVR